MWLNYLNLGLLFVLAFLLLMPLLGLGLPPAWTVVALLVARLAVSGLRAKVQPARRRGLWSEVLVTLVVSALILGQGPER